MNANPSTGTVPRKHFRKCLHDKVAVAFDHELMAHTLFKEHPKLIMAAQEFLRTVAHYNHENAKVGKPTGIRWEELRDLVRTYDREVNYTKMRDALVELRLLDVDGDYEPPTFDPSGHRIADGTCMTYTATAKAHALLNSAAREYFKKLHCDNTLRRKIGKRVSSNRIKEQTYDSPFLQKLHAMRTSVDWDLVKVEKVVEALPAETKSYHYDQLTRLREMKFNLLRFNGEDNRVWSELTSLSRILRPLIRVATKPYWGEIDQRACHASFLGDFLFNHYYSLYSIYDRVETDKGENEGVVEGLLGASVERCFFHTLFNADDDPRPELARRLRVPRDKIKDRLNHWINGKADKKLEEWFAGLFPELQRAWQQMNRKETGPSISKGYETRLWQDMRIYDWLEGHGIAWIYGYDGLSLYGNLTEADEAVLRALINGLAREHFQHEVALKCERHGVGIDVMLEEYRREHQAKERSRAKREARRQGYRKHRALKQEHARQSQELEELGRQARPHWNKFKGGGAGNQEAA